MDLLPGRGPQDSWMIRAEREQWVKTWGAIGGARLDVSLGYWHHGIMVTSLGPKVRVSRASRPRHCK
jgi:hypothetical protein